MVTKMDECACDNIHCKQVLEPLRHTEISKDTRKKSIKN